MPPFASSIRPSFWARASVKAPFSWPNSSLSSSSLGIAAQLISTNGLSCRALMRWIRFAKYSLPVPLSPSISTLVVSPRATCSASGPNSSPKRLAQHLGLVEAEQLLGARG